MRRTSGAGRAATARLLLAAAAAVSTPAAAHPAYHYAGGCTWAAVSDGTDDPATPWTGYAELRVVATDATGAPAAVPVSAECRISVNGGPAVTIVSASGTAVAAGAGTLGYEADPDDVITTCEVVVVGGNRHEACSTPGSSTYPQTLQDLIDHVFVTADAALCPAFREVPPGVPGVEVREDGDLHVAGEWFWDCPPFGS